MCDYFICSCTYTSPLHPASSSTSIFSLYASLSLYIRPHPLHPSSASTPSLSLYIQRNPLHSSSASTPILSVYIHHQPLHQPQPLQRASTSSLILSLYSIHPASVSTSGLLLYESTSIIRLFTQAQLLHSQSASTINPFSASKFGLRLDTQRQIIHPLLASTSGLSLYIQTQPLHPDTASKSSSSSVPTSTSVLSLQTASVFYTPSHPLLSASASASILSLSIQPQTSRKSP